VAQQLYEVRRALAWNDRETAEWGLRIESGRNKTARPPMADYIEQDQRRAGWRLRAPLQLRGILDGELKIARKFGLALFGRHGGHGRRL